MKESLADEYVDKIIGYKEPHKRPIHARKKTEAYCGFGGPQRLRDLSKIDEVTCPKCLKILGLK